MFSFRMQFDPVGDRPVYCMEAKNMNIGCTGKKTYAMCGYANYMQVTDVIILTEQLRQADDLTLYGILQDIRNERCKSTNSAIIETRLLHCHYHGIDKRSDNLTFVVRRNDLRCQLNARLVRKYAEEHGQALHVVHARDMWQGQEIDGPLKDIAEKLDDSKTARLMSRLELSPGCPVILTQNVATELGLVNGAMGVFKHLVYDNSSKGKLHYYAIVEFPSFLGRCSNLPQHWVPVPPLTRSWILKHPVKNGSISVSRTQIPMSPAFCITDYR